MFKSFKSHSKKSPYKEKIYTTPSIAVNNGFKNVVISQKNPGKNKLYLYNSGCEESVEVLENIFKMDSKSIRQLAKELAVLGGEILRALLGKSQPKNYSATDGNIYYRLSSYIPINEDKIFTDANNYLLLKNIFEANEIFPTEGKPVIGAVMQAVFSFFLYDVDHRNFGSINEEEKKFVRIIRFDPGCCFGYFFWEFKETDILKNLQFIADSKLDDLDDKKEEYDEFEFRLAYLKEEENDEKNSNYCKKIYLSCWRNFEAYAALSRLFELPWKVYEDLIETNISPKFVEEKAQLKNIFQKRLEIFKTCAYALKDFEKYYQAYSGPTHLGNFWHSFFDDKFMKKSVVYNILPLTPSYECYEPNYLKNETPENFRKRRYEHEHEHNNADSRHLFFKKIPQNTVSAYILKSEVAETVSVIDELKQLGSSL